MTSRPTPAERMDRALDELLSGATMAAAADEAERRLLRIAQHLRSSLPVPPVAPRFDARLGTLLAERAAGRDSLRWVVRPPRRLLVGGAVGSAAVGVGVTAYAVWRLGHHEWPLHRLLHR